MIMNNQFWSVHRQISARPKLNIDDKVQSQLSETVKNVKI